MTAAVQGGLQEANHRESGPPRHDRSIVRREFAARTANAARVAPPLASIILIRNEVTEGIAGQYVEIYHFADGQVDVRWKGLSLPYAVFDKEQRVNQAEVVENKRLGAALAFVKARRDAPKPPPKVKTASEAGGYVRTGRKSGRRPWLVPETTSTARIMVPPSDAGLKAAAPGGPLRGVGP